MQWLRSFGVGLGAAVVLALAVGGGYAGFERLTQRSTAPAQVSLIATPSSAAAVEDFGTSTESKSATTEQTKQLLADWLAGGTPAERLKSPIMEAAQAAFAQQTAVDPGPLRSKVTLLSGSDYNGKSTSDCQDAADVRSSTEAWLLDIRGDALFVNDGFTAGTKQSVVDLFFRYTIGLFNLAPQLRSYPSGVKSSDGTTAYYEKGLILLGRRTLDQVTNSSCYLQYRRPLQDGYSADRALDLVSRLGFAVAPDYAYPQKASLAAWRAKIAPKLGSASDELLDPYLKTNSGEFYRRAGKALGAGPNSSEAAADKLFREVFPAS